MQVVRPVRSICGAHTRTPHWIRSLCPRTGHRVADVTTSATVVETWYIWIHLELQPLCIWHSEETFTDLALFRWLVRAIRKRAGEVETWHETARDTKTWENDGRKDSWCNLDQFGAYWTNAVGPQRSWMIVTIEMALTHFDFRVSWVCAVQLCDIRSLRLLAVLMWRAKPCSSHSVKTMALWSPPQLIIQTPHPRPQFWHVFHKEHERIWKIRKNMQDMKGPGHAWAMSWYKTVIPVTISRKRSEALGLWITSSASRSGLHTVTPCYTTFCCFTLCPEWQAGIEAVSRKNRFTMIYCIYRYCDATTHWCTLTLYRVQSTCWTKDWHAHNMTRHNAAESQRSIRMSPAQGTLSRRELLVGRQKHPVGFFGTALRCGCNRRMAKEWTLLNIIMFDMNWYDMHWWQ